MIEKVGIGVANKLTLKKRSSKISFWYEDSDKWFVNVQTNTDTSSAWILVKDIQRLIDSYINKGYIIN